MLPQIKRGLVWMSYLILVGCAEIKIKDIEGCGDLGPLGARCNYLFSDRPRDLNKIEWDKKREGMLCFDAAGIGEIKKALMKACELQRCTIEQEKDMVRAFKKLNDLFKEKFMIMPFPTGGLSFVK